MHRTLRRKYNQFMLASGKENATAVGILIDFYTALVQADSKIESLKILLKGYTEMYERESAELKLLRAKEEA